MPISFSSTLCVVSDAIIYALIQDNGPWADAVLSQHFRMPKELRDALLAKELQWTIENKNTFTVLKD